MSNYITLAAASLILLVLLVAAILLRFHTTGNFDLKRMMIDPDTGNVSLSKFGQLWALVMTSWGFGHLVLNNNLTEMYFTIYIGTWAGVTVASKMVSAYKETKTGVSNVGDKK